MHEVIRILEGELRRTQFRVDEARKKWSELNEKAGHYVEEQRRAKDQLAPLQRAIDVLKAAANG